MQRDLDRDQIAQDVLVSLASYLALEVAHRSDRDLLLRDLARVLPRCENGPPELHQVRASAERFLAATNARAQSSEQIYLVQAVRSYHVFAANARLDVLRRNGRSA